MSRQDDRGQDIEMEVTGEKIALVLQGVLAYEFRRYCTRMGVKKNDVVRMALREFLSARGVSTE